MAAIKEKVGVTKGKFIKSGWNGGNQVAAEQIKMHWDKSKFQLGWLRLQWDRIRLQFLNVAPKQNQVAITQNEIAIGQISLHLDTSRCN